LLVASAAGEAAQGKSQGKSPITSKQSHFFAVIFRCLKLWQILSDFQISFTYSVFPNFIF